MDASDFSVDELLGEDDLFDRREQLQRRVQRRLHPIGHLGALSPSSSASTPTSSSFCLSSTVFAAWTAFPMDFTAAFVQRRKRFELYKDVTKQRI